MHYPRTAAEWWHNFDACKSDLRALVASFHPAAHNKPYVEPMEISAGAAEEMCKSARVQIQDETKGDAVELFDKADKERDGQTLLSLLNGAWFGLPESMGSRDLEGFGVLCDLCSESHVLFPEEPE